MESAQVHCIYGKLQGKTLPINGQNVFSFTGVPYAGIPDRFGLPKPSQNWSGIKDCTKQSKRSYQPYPIYQHSSWLYTGNTEDCLYLNIFTPSLKTSTSSESLPVLVFFHGGAFIIGGNNTKEYGPEILMSNHNMVLVTVNYRLGPFGFLNFEVPSCPGNQGMHDQVESLRWVKSNIGHFGGDSSKVTIMGQSAGGMSTMYHLVSPMSKGLFHKIICISGAVMYMPLLHTDRRPSYYAKKFAASLGITDENPEVAIEKLKSLEPSKILSKLFIFGEDFLIGGSPWIPHIDGNYMDPSNSFLPNSFENIIKADKGNPVESILMGFTAQDGLCYASDMLKQPSNWTRIQKDWSHEIPILFFNRQRENVSRDDESAAEKIFTLYWKPEETRPLMLNKVNFQNFEKLSTLLTFKLPFYSTARLLHNHGYNVYGYNFNYNGTLTINDLYRLPPIKFILNILGRTLSIPLFRDSSYGTAHADDLLYIFAFKVPGLSTALTTPSDKRTSHNFKTTIHTFLHEGKPFTGDVSSGKDLAWLPMFDKEGGEARVAFLNDKEENEPWVMDADIQEDTLKQCIEIMKSIYDFKAEE